MSSTLPSLVDLDVRGKRVFLRADLNVPLRPDGTILDDTRIRAVIPTLHHLIRNEARIVLASHLGRPDGKVDLAYSMAPVGMRLAELLYPMASEIKLCEDVVGDGPRTLIRKMQPGEVILLENLRFDPREERNEEAFARALADSIDLYVSEAFACCHRAHASIVGIAKHVPAKAAGFLVEQEVRFLAQLLQPTARPYMVVLGGKKINDKIKLLGHMIPRVQALLVGGALSHPFLQAKGVSLGLSNVAAAQVTQAKQILATAQKAGVPIVLPVDFVAGPDPQSAATGTFPVTAFPSSFMALDIGPDTAALFAKKIAEARTLFWNGPLGAYEHADYAMGTKKIAEAMYSCTGTTVVGGGDTLSALQAMKIPLSFSHSSTGGGATLEFLEGQALPGLVALME